MQKFRVLIHAQNVLTDGGKRLSFYTNVFVEARNLCNAEMKAVAVLKHDKELRALSLNPPNEPIRYTVEEMQELESFANVQLPRTGLAFYEAKTTGNER